MVGKYVRKTSRQSWDEDAMRLALEEIASGMPYKTAGRRFNLPLTTLKRRAKGKNKQVFCLLFYSFLIKPEPS